MLLHETVKGRDQKMGCTMGVSLEEEKTASQFSCIQVCLQLVLRVRKWLIRVDAGSTLPQASANPKLAFRLHFLKLSLVAHGTLKKRVLILTLF